MPSLPDRVMHSLTDAGEVRHALGERRVLHRKDEEREARASALYENLRVLSLVELAELAGHEGTRAGLMADIIEKEVGP